MSVNNVVEGFSVANRCLLYAGILLSPAAFVSGLGDDSWSNPGYLLYNAYTQVQWYRAVKGKELHALSLMLVNFNFFYAITYVGGISSSSRPMRIFLFIGTVAIMILNTYTSYKAWDTNQEEGYGEYQFFFFGWRTLNYRWHFFLFLWQIGDILTLLFSIYQCCLLSFCEYSFLGNTTKRLHSVYAAVPSDGEKMGEFERKQDLFDWEKYPFIVGSAAFMLLFIWPLILWTELIVQRNHIQSDTDWVAVGIFIFQASAMLAPCQALFKSCIWWRQR